jgi:hypothetical protein
VCYKQAQCSKQYGAQTKITYLVSGMVANILGYILDGSQQQLKVVVADFDFGNNVTKQKGLQFSINFYLALT